MLLIDGVLATSDEIAAGILKDEESKKNIPILGKKIC